MSETTRPPIQVPAHPPGTTVSETARGEYTPPSPGEFRALLAAAELNHRQAAVLLCRAQRTMRKWVRTPAPGEAAQAPAFADLFLLCRRVWGLDVTEAGWRAELDAHLTEPDGYREE